MDPIQKQVTVLTHKVDELHHVVGQINTQIAEALAHSQGPGIPESLPPFGLSPDLQPRRPLERSLEHKDVLVDSDCLDLEKHSGNGTLSAEVQIQRLTAQLTAAYNRIAALEEQLMSIRMR